jgi:regulator of RNase E activity RraA
MSNLDKEKETLDEAVLGRLAISRRRFLGAGAALASAAGLVSAAAAADPESGPAPTHSPYTPALIDGYRKVATASVSDAVDKIAGRRGYMDHEIKPVINDRKIVGPAVTVLMGPADVPEPPTLSLVAIDESPAGSVIVVAISGEPNVAVWGGLMTAGAVANGLEAAVLDGGVRDVTEIKTSRDWPVYARSVSMGTSIGRFRTLAANLPVEVASVMVHPGDLVVGDVDGVVVVPVAHVEAVLEMAREIDVREAEQARLIIEYGSLREGIAKYGRI